MNFKWFKSMLIFTTGSLIAVLLLTSQGQSAIRAVYGLAVAQSSTSWNSIRDSSQGDTLLNGLPATGSYRFNGVSWDRKRHSFSQDTNGITMDGAGASMDMTTSPMTRHTMIITRTGGSTNAISVFIACSVDGVSFPTTTESSTITGGSSIVSTTRPCNYLRFFIATIGSGNTLDIDLLSTT